MKWDDLSISDKGAYMKFFIKNGVKDLNLIRSTFNSYAEGGELSKTYKVKKGDSIWKISREHNVSMDEIRQWNPGIKNDIIYPDNELKVSKPIIPKKTFYEDVNVIRSREKSLNQNNVTAIQSTYHDQNYSIIDKKNNVLKVFDKNNKLLFETPNISTGKSGDDYNTITYVNKKGSIVSGKGNESTPAGITSITGKGEYHGVPSFTRGRYNSITKGFEDIAASMHAGNTSNPKASNGCVRVGNEELCKLDKLLTKNSKVYTLPEKEGSRFEVRDGQLNFFADNPYGKNEGSDKYWDDYNVHSNKEFKPLVIVDKSEHNGNRWYSGNRLNYANTVAGYKQIMQKYFNVDSDTYNRIAELAMGIAEQETRFNTAPKKILKNITPDFIMNIERGDTNRSRGTTQIKIRGDDPKLQKIYKYFKVNEDNIEKVDKAAVATMARLLHMYSTEVKGKNFDNDYGKVSPYEALLYKWMGSNRELRNKTATPNDNEYIRNVKEYSKAFEYLSGTEKEIQ